MTKLISRPLRWFTESSPLTILIVSTLIAVIEAAGLYFAARQDGVLYMENGVGLFQHPGMASNLIGNALLPFLARLYYSYAFSVESKELYMSNADITADVLRFKKIINLEKPELSILGRTWGFSTLYIMAFIGLVFWASNTSFHVYGMVLEHWGTLAFDTTNHPWSFVANRINNFYTWLIVYPVCIHVFIWATSCINRVLQKASEEKIATYDLLNPDRCGGFCAFEGASVTFVIAIAIGYVQLAMHTGTFQFNTEHLLGGLIATILLLWGNSMFLGRGYAIIKKLKTAALNEQKEKVYAGEALSLDVIKYFNDTYEKGFYIANFAVKVSAILISVGTKLLPSLTKLPGSLI